MMSIRMLAGTTVASLTLLPALSATAQEGWQGEITPYFWGAGIEGDATVGGRDVDLDVSFDDILDKTDAAGSILGVLQRDRLVFYGQVDYLDLSTDDKTVQGVTGKLETISTIGTLAVGYQFDGFKPGQTFDVLVGARQLSLDNELTLNGRTFEKDQDFTDGILMVRPSFPLGDQWRLNPAFSYGSGDSESVWELWPQLQYMATDNIAARLGYRRLHYDVTGDRGNEFDAAFHGVTFGLGFKF